MASSRLCLNPMKTELIYLGSSRRLQFCPMEPQPIAGVMIKPVTMVRDLGVYLDSDLSLTSHIANITKICFFHIRQLRLVCRSLTLETAEALVRSFIHSRLDYCNGILAGQPDYVYKRLQSVLRSAARLVLLLPCFVTSMSCQCDFFDARQITLVGFSISNRLQIVFACVQEPPWPSTAIPGSTLHPGEYSYRQRWGLESLDSDSSPDLAGLGLESFTSGLGLETCGLGLDSDSDRWDSTGLGKLHR